MFPDIDNMYRGPPLSIKNKKKRKKKKKNIIKNNLKKWNKSFFTLKLKTAYKNEIKDVYWAITAKMTTST